MQRIIENDLREISGLTDEHSILLLKRLVTNLVIYILNEQYNVRRVIEYRGYIRNYSRLLAEIQDRCRGKSF